MKRGVVTEAYGTNKTFFDRMGSGSTIHQKSVDMTGWTIEVAKGDKHNPRKEK